jgi:hypothetical protein
LEEELRKFSAEERKMTVGEFLRRNAAASATSSSSSSSSHKAPEALITKHTFAARDTGLPAYASTFNNRTGVSASTSTGASSAESMPFDILSLLQQVNQGSLERSQESLHRVKLLKEQLSLAEKMLGVSSPLRK